MACPPGHIQIRRDTNANWTSKNPYLLPGEFGYATDTNVLKIGAGNWNNATIVRLPQSIGGALPGSYVTRIYRDTFSISNTGELGYFVNESSGNVTFVVGDGSSSWSALITNAPAPPNPGSGPTGPTGPAGPTTSIVFDGGDPYTIYSSGPVLDCGSFQ